MSNFQTREVVGRGSETELQEGENLLFDYFIFSATSRAE